ncbi:hypothetical protein [Agrococcus sp. SGAir0287]|uniref:hypothetical protein n=1 Tax=Agrococcus sp. SGAir0287 TaxID=2070347 RepID=UPI0010CD0ADE|nr:hypothetical protein [Agrococcus sp. SGAir0287]QCR18923.1 hypothetical protein C1N71_05225 [Agrococcus sp. SGAir0287]
MPRSRRWSDLAGDDGSASVELLTIGMLLTVPLVYLVLAMAQLQAATLATEGAARQAVRVVATAESHADALAAAHAAIAVALADLGLDPSAVEVACTPTPSDCTTRGGVVQVAVETTVPLPLVPPVLDLDVGLSVPIAAQAAQPVSELRP